MPARDFATQIFSHVQNAAFAAASAFESITRLIASASSSVSVRTM